MKNFLPEDLPLGWRVLPLELLVTRMSNGISKRQTKDGNGLPVSRIETISQGVIDLNRVGYLSNLTSVEVEKYRLGFGDLLFSHINSDFHLGKTAVFSQEEETLLHGMNLLLIRVDQAQLLPSFLHWLFNFYRMAGLFMSIAQHAVNQSSINQSKLNALPIVVPPIPEQHRIVAEIEKQFTRLDAGVAALRRVQANLKRYRAAVLKTACEGRLVPTEAELAKEGNRIMEFESGGELLACILANRRNDWSERGKYSEPTCLDSSSLPQLPEGWAWATLDQIGQAGRPIIYGIIKPGPHVPDGVPYVRVTEMKDGRIDVPNLKRASQERAAKFARATLAAGDVLISKDGTIGRVAVVPPELEGGNITQHVMRAPIHTGMSREFVVWAIRSDWCQHWLTGETRGVALRGVNVEDFRRLPIPVPPFNEQLRIVAEVERRLSVIESLEAVVFANLQRAARLRQSILQKAFTGELL
ncbi:MAG TPA: restriction endonuclease subunit S [Holophagaceae bacterium]|nr:restriction endonuclease subunit S [Holophagaceae bacterium]